MDGLRIYRPNVDTKQITATSKDMIGTKKFVQLQPYNENGEPLCFNCIMYEHI